METRYQPRKYARSARAYSYSSAPIFDHGRARNAKYYKPAATSPWTFVAILVLVAGYIMLLEVLLSMQTKGSTNSSTSTRQANARRQDETSATTIPTAQLSLTSPSSSISSSSITGDPPSQSQLTLTTLTTTAPAQLSLTSPPSTFSSAAASQLSLTTPNPQPPTTTPMPSSQLSLTASITMPASQLSLTTPVPSSQPASQLSLTTPMSSSQLSLTTPIPPASTIAASQLSLATVFSKTYPITTTPRTTIPSTLGTSFGQISSTEAGEPSTASQMTFTVPDSTLSFQPTVPVDTGTSTPTVTGDPISTNQLSIVTVTTTTSASASASTLVLAESHVLIGGTFTKLDYFYSLYLPTLLAVIFQTIWSVVFAATKMMEPFHQLAKPNGALARDSILCEYLSPLMSMASLRAIVAGHWAMLLASVTYLAAGLLAPLASESMGVVPTATCHTSISLNQPCAPAWIVYLRAARALESVLAFLFISVFLLFLLNLRRTSGVFEDPSSIRSMASLLGEPNVLRDFQEINPNATKSEVRRSLAGNRYKLGHYENATRTHHRYGLIKLNKNEWQEPSSQYGYTAVENPGQKSSKKTSRRSKPMSIFLDTLHILLTLTLFSLILTYYLDGASDPLNNFFNSATFGPRFLLSSLAVLLSSGWKRLERETRIMSTYRNLSSSSPQRAKRTIDVTMTGTPLTTIFLAVGRGDFFASWVALVAVLSDILIIAVTSVPFSRAQIHEAGIAAFYISFGVLGLMMLTLVAVFVRRRWDPQMPRNPDTLAYVWLYLCASNMVVRGEMDRRTKEADTDGKRYWFGVSRGTDGKERWMVDEDRHGVAQALNYAREPEVYQRGF